MDLVIRPDDLTGEAILALLRYHLDEMHRHSPADSVHALPPERLRHPDVSFYSAWYGETLAGCGALREVEPGHGEIKTMRVAPATLRKGVGRAILRHLLEEARSRGFSRVSLETGSTAPFHPAHALYRAHAFVECAPFADYVLDDFSICMTLEL
ncbi:GNAT family N-acetyltransferase [Novosphingobium sp. YJ-S2-02]|uniref:GNAT family N-acetyltransferase n=1 Tax=Novosphingobium aureum TaxID=2792964 RepID=A0A931H9X0_9SPHN|nr:GNAT family N-acetyltransferase [Novosphingobium aureum]MBH0111644.1 GNAT family N-acetyltransferase [Novosphingobium aureum]